MIGASTPKTGKQGRKDPKLGKKKEAKRRKQY